MVNSPASILAYIYRGQSLWRSGATLKDIDYAADAFDRWYVDYCELETLLLELLDLRLISFRGKRIYLTSNFYSLLRQAKTKTPLQDLHSVIEEHILKHAQQSMTKTEAGIPERLLAAIKHQQLLGK